ncbi:MAG: hypothetical protein PWQ57_3037 [Desulfovibrionales bacterium]|nr:hypothetical protein [Desulfovibrionales bacterium]
MIQPPVAGLFVLAAGLLLLLAGCAPGPAPHPRMDVAFVPRSGEFFTANGTRLSAQDFSAMAARVDYLLIGETHDSVCDHAAQAEMVRSLACAGVPFVLGLEMIPANMTAPLASFNRGETPAEDLEQALDWDDLWGYPFELFVETFRTAARAKAPVYGLNIPSALIKKTRRMGLSSARELDRLDAAERAQFPSKILFPPPEQIAELDAVLRMHPDVDKELEASRRDRFLFIQSVWDSKMAEEAAALRRRHRRLVVALAGEGHVLFGYGIKRRLQAFDPGAKTLLVGGVRSLDQFDPHAADVFFYCPPEHASRMGMRLQDRETGVEVVAITPGGRAFQAGLRPGDVIEEANGIPVVDLMDLHRAGSEAYHDNAPLRFVIRRGGERYTVDLGRLGQGRSR